MTTPGEQQRARRHRLALDLGASAVLVVSAGVAAIWGLAQ
jgi:diacylglycerol kinase